MVSVIINYFVCLAICPSGHLSDLVVKHPPQEQEAMDTNPGLVNNETLKFEILLPCSVFKGVSTGSSYVSIM